MDDRKLRQQAIRNLFAGENDEEFQKVVITRPSATSFLGVDSANRYDRYNIGEIFTGTQSPYNFEITRDNNVLTGYFNRIALTEIVFPYFIPNVNAYTNALEYKINGGPLKRITLDIGFYTPTQLAEAVQVKLRSVSGGLPDATCIYNQDPYTPFDEIYINSFTIETHTTDEIEFFYIVKATGSTLSNENRFQLADMMALPVGAGSYDVVIGRTTRCRPIDYIDVVCSNLTYNQELKDSSTSPLVRDVIARLYIETETQQLNPYYDSTQELTIVPNISAGTYPFTIYRQFNNPKQIKWDNKMPLGNLKFELYDNWGNPLVAGLNASGFGDNTDGTNYMPDWRMTLLVSED
jgi:hypothetical protein